MIRIELDEPTLARTRIATSPLWETLCSLFLLRRAQVPWPYDRWAARARSVLATVPETAPVDLVFRLGWRFPDFLSPIPRSASPTIEEELDRLRATDPDVMAAEINLQTSTPDLDRFLKNPVRALGELADGLQAYWDAALAPYWPAMRGALDEEMLFRARLLAADGPDALLGALHDRVRWEYPVLTLVKPPEADRSHEREFAFDDQRLLLIPLIFSRGALMCTTREGDVVAVSYQARGSVVLADRRRERPGEAEQDRLAVLLGNGRAAVLCALYPRPSTTAGLAATLGLAPSTVSEHLSILVAAGVAHRHRAGRRVLYGLEPAGLALVDLLGPPEAVGALG
ncbi:ArsR family transcriptional regulator [Streptosporangium sp. CA-135522]|uniref:ArsR family transcriptional regulator n=1 Tax=Streptosporangium sp. CA-135522 TaxID=3240072 RepID=UPI003D93BD78